MADILIVGCGAHRAHKVSSSSMQLNGVAYDVGHQPHDARGATSDTVDIEASMHPTYHMDFTKDQTALLPASHYQMVKFEKTPFFIFQGGTSVFSNAFHTLKSGGAVTIITGGGGLGYGIGQSIRNGLTQAGFANITIMQEDNDKAGIVAAATKP